MKNICFTILSISLLSIGISSCKKSTKGKLSNEWTVTSWEEKKMNQSENGTIAESVNVSGSSITSAYTTQQPGQPEESGSISGTVRTFKYTIKKDGTWSLTKDYTLNSSSSSSSDYVTEMSGTWNFLNNNKSESFKKNERIIFNVLKERNYTLNINNGANVGENEETNSYLTGERSMMYTIVESKQKELQLKYETENQSHYSGQTAIIFSSGNMKLEQE